MRLSLLLLALTACKHKPVVDTDEVLPPAICHDPAGLPDGDLFDDATAEMGLQDVRGNRMTAVDYDEDGWVDLLVGGVGSHATNTAGAQFNYLLKNEQGVFRDVTFESGITSDRDGGDDRAFQVASWGDVDNDGDLDLFSGYYRDRNNESTWTGDTHEVLLNQGDGTFALANTSDATFESAIAGASFVDYDRDGVLDLWTVGFYYRYGALTGEQDLLLKGAGAGEYDDVTADLGLEMISGNTSAWLEGTARRPAYGATVCDVNDDGRQDLIASNYGRAWNQLWLNDGDGFTDIGPTSGFAGDANQDYSDNEFYRCYCASNSCDPDPGPPSISCGDYWTAGFDDQPARLNGNTFTTVCGDIDNDGDLDLYNAEIVHWHIGGSSDASELLLNDGTGVFTRPGNESNGLARARPSGWNEGDLQAAFIDFDNDGWKDILLASSDYEGTKAWLWRQTAPGLFEDVTDALDLDHERASGLAVADFDRDGDLDIVLGASTMRSGWDDDYVFVYESALGPSNHAEIGLVGTTANHRGLGARVTVEAGGLTQTFEVQGSYGHMGIQQPTDLWVGLGAACTIDRITVRWPDAQGTEEVWENVLGNYRVRLTQGGGIEYLTE